MARIALILPRLSHYGGVEQFAFRLAEALAETHDSEHEVEFICARAECLPPVGVQTHVVGRVGGFKSLKMLWFLVCAERARKRGKYDLTIGLGKTWNQDVLRVGGGPQRNFWKLSAKAWPAGFSRWFKSVRRHFVLSNWLTRIIDNHQYRSGCRIICVSDAVRDWVQGSYPGIPTPEVIYNLPDLSRFSPPSTDQRNLARARLDLDAHHTAIATATSNFMLKGTGVLIRALALLPDTVHLYVAGGRAPLSYEHLADSLGVRERVHFLGLVDDMPALFRGMDLFVLPSFYDACSNAVLEA
ncbi:MAG: glycosyltransferase family 4 protein, partial [Bilophila sp.]